MRSVLFSLVMSFAAVAAFSQTRSFESLYPGIRGEDRAKVYSEDGLLLSEEGASLKLLPASTGVNISEPVLRRNPSFVVESLRVIPYNSPSPALLHVYNALGKVSRLKGRLYHSATRNQDIPLFEEASRIRIIDSSRTQALNDPPNASAIPRSETVHLRLKDVNFGNSYYQAEMSYNQRSILYSLSNFRSLSYGIIPVIRENRFVAQLYIEPITDGFLVYSVAAANVSGFISSRIHIPSAIEKRLAVIIEWLVDGLKNS
ncbi:MAG: hypothetical protein LBH73_07715 [Spirochaetaceae bacterium]|jgi:hypothetical protein|nr:hypothetical protein [Spirochaetaceae bacterium]